jgi:hypothetical protein
MGADFMSGNGPKVFIPGYGLPVVGNKIHKK